MTTYINPGNNTGLYGLDDIVVNTGYGNANVESFLATGSDTGGNIVGNIVAAGNITSSGNVTANYFIGDGSQLTNVGTYGNANVATLLASFGSNTISTTGNITGGYIFGNGSGLTGLPATYANANVATFLANFGSNTISTTGNITGGNLIGTHIGSGAALSSITGANVTGTVANATYATSAGSATTATSATTAGTVTTAAQANITSVGTLTSLDVSGNVTIAGNLTVSGNTYVANVQTLEVQDPIIGLGRGPNNTPLTTNDGKDRGVDLWYYTSSEQQAFMGYDNSAGKMILANNVSITNEVVTVNNYGNTVVGALEATSASASGNVTGGNVLTPGFVTAVGNITGGNLITGGLVNASASITAGTAIAAGTTISAVGNVTGGNINTAGIVSATGNIGGGNVSTTGNVTGAYIKGDGSQLTNITVSFPGALTQDLNTAGYKIYNAITNGNLTLGSAASTGNVFIWSNNNYAQFNGQAGTLTLNGFGLFGSSISASGNVTGGNLTTAGLITATGNITGGNVRTAGVVSAGGGVLATGNISATGNINGNPASSFVNAFGFTGDYAGIADLQCTTLTAAGNIYAAGSDIFTGNVHATGTGQGIITANKVSVTGNIVASGGGAYFVGDGSYLTNLPMGSGNMIGNINGGNTYSINNLQDLTINPTGGNITIGSIKAYNFNNRWYFNTDTDIAGRLYATGNLLTDSNVVATSNVIGGNLTTAGQVTATGNITGGNIVINGSNMQSKNAWDANTSPQQARITMGTGYNGDYTTTYDALSTSRGSQLAVITKQTIGNADTNQSLRLTTSTLYADLGGATLTNNNRRLQAMNGTMYIGNGVQNMTTNPYFGATGAGGAVFAGSNGNVNMGNIDLGHAAGALNSAAAGGGANLGNAIGTISTVSSFNTTANITTGVGYAASFTTTATPTVFPTTVIGYYMPNATATYGINSSNNYRRASNYYFLKNDDDVAQNQLGSLRSYTEFNAVSGTTSGALTIDKTAGQVQQVNLAGNITGITLSNFVSSASDGTNTDEQSDTVTVIFNQGSTGGYGVTFPSGSTYKYAGNITALQSTAANSVSLASISAIRLSGTTTYLITISPGFV